MKSLDRKLAAIHADPSGCREFILADAKDADMAFGIGAPGKSPEAHPGEVRFRTLEEYREQIRQIVAQGLVDIMLMSASTNEVLTIAERLFDDSAVTPAARANDTSDIFVVRGGSYVAEPSRPFRTATIDHIQCGRFECAAGERAAGADLGLYSITFNNRLEQDLEALEAYRRFRLEAERKGFRHFLELFDPNAPQALEAAQVPGFINDCVARTLAGVTRAGRPLFLKMVYHGPKAMEELVAYDPQLVVGIMGGSAGTTYDAFKLLAEAQKYGARVALYGRKINGAENQLAFVQFLRLIVEGDISPEDAVRAYHGVLGRLKIKPHRPLEDDLQLQTAVMSYGGGSTATVPAGLPRSKPGACGCASAGTAGQASSGTQATSSCPSEPKSDCGCGGTEGVCRCDEKPSGASGATAGLSSSAEPSGNNPPDFSNMTQAEKLAYNQARRDRIFG